MAIYHLQCKVSKRSQGKSAIAAAAYRRGIALHDLKTDELYNYTNKEEVIHSGFAIPENSPEWLRRYQEMLQTDEVAAMEKYWNYYEDCETRIDAQLTRDFIVALPKELTTEQQIKLAQEFVEDQMAKRGMVVDYSIHHDEGNPHLHISTSMRSVAENGFGEKNRAWNDKVFLKNIRMSWAEYANFHLKLAGHDVRIDHRSYEEMGIDLIPSFHIGRAAYDMNRRGMKSDLLYQAEQIREENLARIKQNPNIIFNKMMFEKESFTASEVVDEIGRYTRASVPDFEEVSRSTVLSDDKIKKILGDVEHHESVFTDRDLAKSLEKSLHSDDAKVFTQALAELKVSKELIYLGPGDDGRDRYTTRKMFELENGIQTRVDELREGKHFKIAPAKIEQYLKEYEEKTGKKLESEQADAVRYALEDRQIGCIVGRAGTGKSFSLGAANAVWEKMGFEVHGVALSGIAADGLDKDAGMNATTIESFKLQIQSGNLALKKRSVVVMDEAGMTDSVSMAFVTNAVKKAEAKLILVGDHAQLQPVGPGAAFRAIIERLPGPKELKTVYRQKDWQADATSAFARGNIEDALNAYDQHGCVHYLKKKETAFDALAKEWGEAYSSGKSIKDMIVLGYTREDVKDLNLKIRQICVTAGKLNDSQKIKTERGTIELAPGDRILFLKNNRELGVKNGRFAVVDSIEEKGGHKILHATLDGDAAKKVEIDTLKYKDFDYGYAATVHKTQGVTVDKSFLYISKGWDRCLAYVGMSRHRETCQVFTELENKEALTKEVKRYAAKDSLFDFAYHFAVRRGLDSVNLGERLLTHLKEKITEMKARVTGHYNELHGRHWDQVKETVASNPEFSKTLEMREKARLVAAYADANREIGIVFERVQDKLAEIGLKKPDYRDPRMAIIRQSEEYKNMLAYLTHRDQLAQEILTDLPTYAKAVEVSNIDMDKLKAHARKHENREIVAQYTQDFSSGRALLRDKIAMQMASNIKDFYPLLLEAKVDTSQLYNQARTHERRLFSKSLTAAERVRLHEVERYLALIQEAGAVFVKNAEKLPGADKLSPKNADFYKSPHYKKIVKERDAIAFKVFSHIEDYNKALDFYEIGLARPRFGSMDKPNEDSIRRATKRWYNLEQQAANHQMRLLLRAYVDAASANNLELRGQIASEMIQNKKAAFREFAQEYGAKNTMWFEIHKDAKAFDSRNFYKGLTNNSERALFKQVEEFIVARTESRKAWSEVLQGQPSPVDFASLDGLFSESAKSLARTKSELARELLKIYKPDQAVYQYFNLDLESLKNEAGYKKMDANAVNLVTQYQKFCVEGKNYVERARLAQTILQNKDVLKGVVSGLGVDWKVLFKDSVNGNRHYLANDLLSSMKGDLRIVWKYDTANRASGKLWSEIAELKKNKQKIPSALQRKAEAFSAERDSLAFKLRESGVDNLVKFFLQGKGQKIAEQAEKHQERLELAKQYIEKRDPYITALNRMVTQGKYSVDFIYVQDELAEHMKAMEKRPHVFQYALRACGVDQGQLAKDRQLFNVYSELAFRSEGLFERGKDQKYALDLDEQAKIKRAQKIFKGTVPIQGTLAERYLREHRHITGGLPESCRYHPGVWHHETGKTYPALVVAARNLDKSIGVPTIQVIYLDKDTGKKAALESPKLTYGRFLDGSAVIINKGKDDGRIAIAEGPETALSIKEANPDLRIYSVLGSGNLKKVPITDKMKEVLICADNDYPRIPAAEKVMPSSEVKVLEAAKYFAEKGLDVSRIMPEKAKDDFNDVLIKEGVEKVREYLSHPEKLNDDITIERLENEVKEHLIQDAKQKEPKETVKLDGDRVTLPKGLTKLLEGYLAAEAAYDKAATDYFANISSSNKAEFKKIMDQAAEQVTLKIDGLLKSPVYQEMIKHGKYELQIGGQRETKTEQFKETLKDGIITTGQVYKLQSQIESNAQTLGMTKSQSRSKGRSV